MRQSFIDLLEKTKNKTGNIMACEVGIFKAENAIEMLKAMPHLILFLVDNYKNLEGNVEFIPAREAMETAFKNLSADYNILKRIVLIYNNSAIASLYFPRGYFDYVYIDAEHDYNSCYEDLVNWYFTLKEGGILAGHDFGMSSVKDAINNFTHFKNITYSFLDTPGNSDWWIFK